MANTPTPNAPTVSTPTQDEVYAAVTAAYEALEDVYNASEGADSVACFKALSDLSRIRTALNLSHLESRTGEFEATKAILTEVTASLKTAQKKIETIIKVTARVAQVVGVIDKAVSLLAKYFA